MRFDDELYVYGKIDADFSEFCLDFRFRSLGHRGGYEASETTPPMPFRIGSLALYRLGHFYQLVDRASKLSAELEGPEVLNRCTIIQKTAGTARGSGKTKKPETRTTVYYNGKEVAKVDKPSSLQGHFTIGIGFQQRFWRGDFEFLDLVTGKTGGLVPGRDDDRHEKKQSLIELGKTSTAASRRENAEALAQRSLS